MVAALSRQPQYGWPHGVTLCFSLMRDGPGRSREVASTLAAQIIEKNRLDLFEAVFRGLSITDSSTYLIETLRERAALITAAQPRPTPPPPPQVQVYGPIIVGPRMPVPQPAGKPAASPAALPRRKP